MDREYTVKLPDTQKGNIKQIILALENCEDVVIYNKEIVSIELEFEEELLYDRRYFSGDIKSGYIKIKLCDDYNEEREEENDYLRGFSKKYKKLSMKQILTRELARCAEIVHLGISFLGDIYSISADVPYETDCDEDNEEITVLVSASSEMDAEGNVAIYFGNMSKFEPYSYELD